MYLISNYWSNRSHFVQTDPQCSNFLYSKLGIPQGSILGPALFNLCVCDMKNYVPSCALPPTRSQFNNILPLQSERYKTWANLPTSEFSNMLAWCSSKNLTFNAAKTKLVLFTTSHTRKDAWFLTGYSRT